ncbi:MAG: 2-oxoacid:acceptor oxidoreductase subunit alpha, partial [Alphaproteobacteria bacterium]|nr:2-oxoacid:acceptor oxidoreductase subunit alpha [Alphaproteobacteria bacterium]
TLPDFPAEIRAPAGTLAGVSGFQIQFGSVEIFTPGDQPDVLVAMNPAALKVNLSSLKPGGTVVVDTGSFNDRALTKAGYEANPLEDGTVAPYKVIPLDISKMTLESVKEFGLSNKEAMRCKNMWTLGLMLWMYGRQRQSVVDWLKGKFAKAPHLADANVAALNAGHAFGETAELAGDMSQTTIGRTEVAPGIYRTITGAESLALGLVAGGKLAGLDIMLGSYPITPASTLLHQLARLKEHGVVTFQAEDEIAAICSAIGASFAGSLGVTSSSGPGIALKTEAMGLAITTELPLVIVNSQRGGPSTGLPTKTEQSDLYQAVYGRNGDAPLPVIASSTPGDCFETAIEAVRIATKYMTPVILLTDGYLANAAEPWPIPDFDSLEPFPVTFETNPEGFSPFKRDPETLARNWAVPGTKGTEHRIGGIEKDYNTGNISYAADNHQLMTDTRWNKVLGIADDIPEQEVAQGGKTGRLAVVGWGSTFGPIYRAVEAARAEGLEVSQIHVRYMWPLPRNLGDLLQGFDKVLVPEMNKGQFATVLRDQYLVDAVRLNQVNGQPFKVSHLTQVIRDLAA